MIRSAVVRQPSNQPGGANWQLVVRAKATTLQGKISD